MASRCSDGLELLVLRVVVIMLGSLSNVQMVCLNVDARLLAGGIAVPLLTSSGLLCVGVPMLTGALAILMSDRSTSTR